MARRNKSSSSAAISEEVMSKFKAIVVLTDAFCKRHLNEEYVKMCRRLALVLARKAAHAHYPRQGRSLGLRDRANHRLGERSG